MPVLMVGAGLFLAGSKSGQAATRKAAEVASDLSDEVGRQARDFGNEVRESASAAKTYASDQLDRVSAAVSSGTDQMSRAADAAGSLRNLVCHEMQTEQVLTIAAFVLPTTGFPCILRRSRWP